MAIHQTITRVHIIKHVKKGKKSKGWNVTENGKKSKKDKVHCPVCGKFM